jgi:hypothetical protein
MPIVAQHPRLVRELFSPAGSQVEEKMRRFVPRSARVDQDDVPTVGVDREQLPALVERYSKGGVLSATVIQIESGWHPEPPELLPSGRTKKMPSSGGLA